MKKLILAIGILAGSTFTNAQNIDSLVYADQDTAGLALSIAMDEAAWSWPDTLRDGNYDHVDGYVLGMNKRYKNIPDLANDINRAFDKDEEKIRAIFIWMTKNIVYDYVELKSKNKTIGKGISYAKGTSKLVIAEKWEKAYFAYASKVLRKRRGICEGYATLFYELCRYSNINCEMVTGYASVDSTKINRYKKMKLASTNHAWNKVLLHDEWLFIDVTWASTGSYDGKRKDPERYAPFYYLVKESNLYPTHLVNSSKTKRRNEIVGNY